MIRVDSKGNKYTICDTCGYGSWYKKHIEQNHCIKCCTDCCVEVEENNSKSSGLCETIFNHCKEQNLTYWQHFRQAIGYSSRLLLAGIACLIHAFNPALFETTASKEVERLNKNMGQSEGWQNGIAPASKAEVSLTRCGGSNPSPSAK